MGWIWSLIVGALIGVIAGGITKKGESMVYHSSEKCLRVTEKYWPLQPFTWGELEEEQFRKLTPCPAGAPQPRITAVDALNEKNTRK